MAKSMGYCRFRNALTDMRDIRAYLDEMHSTDGLSPEEAEAYDKVIEMCRQIAEDFL